ncbi:CidA/LrgA family protein [Lihuaxuella thermophila]|uniref:Holin-like protein n=1 Tax=Lihuaxuella thermophila TaxID=1173111 RepID=A0A1H8C6U6_9BACL|nr:CidA/LrgA family protein [Lihuaxuella thermophila]SEM90609.1 holin-like protein [Lihuaxuella thermophila]
MVRILLQFLTILTIYLTGNGLVAWLHLPLPGSFVGMILLFAALSLGVFKLPWIETIARLHIRHFSLLLIPSIIGVVHYTGAFKTEGIKLAIILTASSFTVLLVTAFTAEYFETRRKRRKQDGNISQ